MSRLVKDRKAAKREILTMNKLANAVTILKQKEAKGDAIEKARQKFMAGLTSQPLYIRGGEK